MQTGKTLHGVLLFLLTLPFLAGGATITTFSGVFEDPNELGMGTFTLTGTTYVWIQTWSWGGGVASDGTVVAGGNFDPMITVFAGDTTGPSAGSAVMTAFNDDGLCPPGTAQGERCLDSTLGNFHVGQTALVLAAGTYSVVVSMFPNYYNAWIGGTFDAGFAGGAVFGAEIGRAFFVDVQGEPVPEPAAALLTGAGLALAALLSRRGRS